MSDSHKEKSKISQAAIVASHTRINDVEKEELRTSEEKIPAEK